MENETMTMQKAETLRGVKFYKKVDNDEYEIRRIINLKMRYDGEDKGTVIAEYTSDLKPGRVMETQVDNIVKDYKRITPDGCVVFTIGREINPDGSFFEDVIVATYTADDVNNQMASPSVVCRQLVRDFMYDLKAGFETSDNKYVGVCVTRDMIPADQNYMLLTEVKSVSLFAPVNYYIDDTVSDILTILGKTNRENINAVLEANFLKYIEHIHGMDLGQNHTDGHCRNLETLLEINNYQFYHDSVHNIVTTNLNIGENTKHVPNEDGSEVYEVLTDSMTEKLSRIYQKKITKAITMKYDQDLNLDRLDKSSILLVRDITDTLYLIHITVEGEYLKKELEEFVVNNVYDAIRIVNKYGSKKSK